MWSKRNRYAVCTRLFEDLYWSDMDLNAGGHEHFSDMEYDSLLPGDKLDPVDMRLVDEAGDLFHSRGEEWFRNEFSQYVDDWVKTSLPVRTILFTWVLESEMSNTERKDLVGKYIKLAQDVVAGGNTGLVHAILSKMTGSERTDRENVSEENIDQSEE